MAEVAGLVLGAFPLLIEGLKIYADGARTIGDMINHDLILDEFCRDLEVEKTKFDDTYFQLLEGMTVDPSMLAELECNPGSAQWRSEEVRTTLDHRFRQSSLDVIVRTTKELYSILQRLQKDFEPKRNKAGTKFRLKSLKRLLGKLDVALNEDYRNKQIARIRQLNADIRILVCGNTLTHTSTVSTNRLRGNPAVQYGHIKRDAVSLYNTIKEEFQEKTCGCEEPHSASLQLEMRTSHLKTSKAPSAIRFHLLIFRSMTPNPKSCECRQLELEILDSGYHPEPQTETCQHVLAKHKTGVSLTAADCDINDNGATLTPSGSLPACLIAVKKPQDVGIRTRIKGYLGVLKIGASLSRPTSLAPESQLNAPNLQTDTRGRKRKNVTFTGIPEKLIASTPLRSPEDTCGLITSLCSTIDALCPDINTTPPHPKCLGVLVNKQGDQLQRLRISLRGWLTFQPQGILPLESILNCHPKPALLDRLILGVNIASAMMQLYESGWLNASWGKNDIFFLQGAHGPVLERPLIHRVFHDQKDKASPDSMPKDCNESEWALTCSNQSIFYLGVILIELWYWKPLSLLQTESGWFQENSSPSEFDTARRFVRDLLVNAGASYGQAVNLCIMGWGETETQLDREGFRSEVYTKIVYPLEEDLKRFVGKTDLAAIYQG